MDESIKGLFRVSAGVVPDVPMPELCLRLAYTQDDWNTDRARAPHDRARFAELREAALGHAEQLMDPGVCTWVRVEFVCQ